MDWPKRFTPSGNPEEATARLEAKRIADELERERLANSWLVDDNRAQVARNEALEKERGIEPLTGLSTRAVFEYNLEQEIINVTNARKLHHRAGDADEANEVCVLFLDLDNFKEVNDTLGHLRGDDILKKVATLLRSSVREKDVVARFGGDEFYILLPKMNDKRVVKVANHILENLNKDTELSSVGIGASLGIASSKLTLDPQKLVHFADIAVQGAKGAGKNTYVLSKGEDVQA